MEVQALLYLILCWIAAHVGRNTRLGFWGVFFFSVLFTPIWALISTLLFGFPATDAKGRPGTAKTEAGETKA